MPRTYASLKLSISWNSINLSRLLLKSLGFSKTLELIKNNMSSLPPLQQVFLGHPERPVECHYLSTHFYLACRGVRAVSFSASPPSTGELPHSMRGRLPGAELQSSLVWESKQASKVNMAKLTSGSPGCPIALQSSGWPLLGQWQLHPSEAPTSLYWLKCAGRYLSTFKITQESQCSSRFHWCHHLSPGCAFLLCSKSLFSPFQQQVCCFTKLHNHSLFLST